MRYLFYVTLSYSYSVLRPIEKAIKQRGGSVAWFIPKGSEAEPFLKPSDKRLMDVTEVKQFAADATLAPGNFIPDFFPGIKVQVFHGFDSGKKGKFNIRGFFDLYCTQGPNITKGFEAINDGTCEIVETGWSKLDPLFTLHANTAQFQSDKPVILYAPTFSPKLTSTEQLYSNIQRLTKTRDWQWIVKLHPKATSEEVAMYKALSSENLRFIETGDVIPLLQAADIILSDTSSILAEFAIQEKIVVAFNSRRPEKWMLNFEKADDLEKVLDKALFDSDDLLSEVKNHSGAIHPYKDGLSSERALDAMESLIQTGIAHLKKKPLNLIRRFKIRKKLQYYRWS
ncbi:MULTISPECIES: CDP-glycerol glycerophosphotransferase family protein [unclassified Shewanella]|uniref:CDP-glycerol glycerophosphotransferase family protein n=1 Tax=unclassified Shewanella TaxID=196818 RepID=UPI000C862784|nr:MULTISPECIES: CDP-glycerol glycerophosphotransferase family protein [unclassified Shewanella]MDO6639518.1 CDP-glycerol glycerophosphotransferase family protein [Shewanella sp. 5_MG-2023]PMH89080.1 CDP-glycerol:glycerophosphate glycerophosphotransferase [Shewanella sp. 10N.286.48.B5]